MITLTCAKRFGPYPFAHRQPNHAGHCQLIHGHNWDFVVTFAATERDKCGFVVDFGGAEIKRIRENLAELFDHTLVLNFSDPFVDDIKKFLDVRGIANVTQVMDSSCEGLAEFIYMSLNLWLKDWTKGRVSVIRVTVNEDEKNSASYGC